MSPRGLSEGAVVVQLDRAPRTASYPPASAGSAGQHQLSDGAAGGRGADVTPKVRVPPATVATTKTHSPLANSADSTPARHTSSSGSPTLTLPRLGNLAEAAWLIAAMTKIRNEAPPIRAKLCTPSVPCRNVGTRLLKSPRTVNAANTPRPAPSMTARIPGGTPIRGRRRNAW